MQNFFLSIFFPQVSPANLWGRTLRILVYNIDVNRKHRILGQTLLELADVDLSQGRLVSINLTHLIKLFQTFHFLFQNLNADLQKFVNLNDLPELLLSVCYNATLQRLTVNVVEGKNFKVKCFMPVSVLKSPCWYLRIYFKINVQGSY